MHYRGIMQRRSFSKGDFLINGTYCVLITAILFYHKSSRINTTFLSEMRPKISGCMHFRSVDRWYDIHVHWKFPQKTMKIINTLETDSSYIDHSFGNVKTIPNVGSF